MSPFGGERTRGEKRDAGDRRACRGVEEEVVSSRDDHEQHEERIGNPSEAHDQVRPIASEAWPTISAYPMCMLGTAAKGL